MTHRPHRTAALALTGLLALGGVSACSEAEQDQVEQDVREGVQKGTDEVQEQVDEGAEEGG